MISSIDQTRPLWFILGPSGAGKSSFGQWLAAERKWLHLEIDRYPDGDGIDLNSLRSEWDEFYMRKTPDRLTKVVQQHLKPNEEGAVLTFPGNLVLDLEHLRAAADVGIRTRYLYGTAADCVMAFLDREQTTGRNLNFAHWATNNRDSYMRMSDPSFAPFRVSVFTCDGARRPHIEVFGTLLNGN